MEFNKYAGIGKSGEKIRVTIASGPVITEKGKVLVDKHGDDKFWKFPGGRQLDDNNFLENAKREVKEELGIDVTLEKKPCIMAFERDKDNIKEYVILIHYLAKRKGEIKMGRDVREYRWLNIKKLPEDCAPNIKPVLNYFNKRL